MGALLEQCREEYCWTPAIANLGLSYLQDGNLVKARALFQEAASQETEMNEPGEISARLAFIDYLMNASKAKLHEIFQQGDAKVRQTFLSAGLIDSHHFKVGDRVRLRDLTSL